LARLAKKNPKANATMEEIISVVEEVRTEYFYGKKIIIADTNWWISLVISNFENSFASLLEDETLEFYSCDELENEILNVFRKIKLQKFLNEEIIKTFWLSFNR